MKLTFGTLPTGAVVSITDDDVPAVTVSYEQATYTVPRGELDHGEDVKLTEGTTKETVVSDGEL